MPKKAKKLEPDDPKASRLLMLFLRFYAGLTQRELGEITGHEQTTVSRYESGQAELSPEILRQMAEAVGVPWPLARDLRRCFSSVIRSTERRWRDQGLDAGMIDTLLQPALVALFPFVIEELMAEPEPPTPEEQRAEAEEIWTNLQRHSLSKRRRLLEITQGAYPSWALAERICEASFQAAASEPDHALELADLALFVAGTIEDGPWRSRVEGYCWAHLGHARRAAQDLAGAEEASARARDLWQAGAEGDRGWLGEERFASVWRPR
jgi:transcriptional regulator with XRE-family HTH domain